MVLKPLKNQFNTLKKCKQGKGMIKDPRRRTGIVEQYIAHVYWNVCFVIFAHAR